MHKVMEVLAVKLNLILKQKTSVESHICIWILPFTKHMSGMSEKNCLNKY